MPPMNWTTLLSADRLGKGHSGPGVYDRSRFQKDYDRITFSAAFRRLQRKTHVHTLPENGNVHNRLTHSLEVSSVARSLGQSIGQRLEELGELPDGLTAIDIGAITQAAGLAHDIGNPPFGHAGEFVIRDWFTGPGAHYIAPLSPDEQGDFTTYEGNANGFRLLASRNNGIYDGGMRLTYATLASFIKYPWSVAGAPVEKRHKFGAFRADLPLLTQVAEITGLSPLGPERWARHPLVYVVEAADDICYGLIDIEDGVELGLIDFDEWEAVMLPFHPGPLPQAYRETPKYRRKLSYLRGKVIDRLLDDLALAFINNRERFLRAEDVGDLFALCDDGPVKLVTMAKQLAANRIYLDHREAEAFRCLDTLLACFIEAAWEISRSPDGEPASAKPKQIWDHIGADQAPPTQDLYQNYMAVMDFIGGMTDDYALTLARELADC